MLWEQAMRCQECCCRDQIGDVGSNSLEYILKVGLIVFNDCLECGTAMDGSQVWVGVWAEQ